MCVCVSFFQETPRKLHFWHDNQVVPRAPCNLIFVQIICRYGTKQARKKKAERRRIFYNGATTPAGGIAAGRVWNGLMMAVGCFVHNTTMCPQAGRPLCSRSIPYREKWVLCIGGTYQYGFRLIFIKVINFRKTYKFITLVKCNTNLITVLN